MIVQFSGINTDKIQKGVELVVAATAVVAVVAAAAIAMIVVAM